MVKSEECECWCVKMKETRKDVVKEGGKLEASSMPFYT